MTAAGGRHRRRRATTWTRRQVRSWWRASTPSRAGWTCWSTTSGAARSCSSWDTPLWEHDLDDGLRLLRLAVETHLITSHHALPLLIRRPGGLVVEMTDGTRDYNDAHLPREPVLRPGQGRGAAAGLRPGQQLEPHGCAAVALTPGWLRSEMMLEAFGVTEDDWNAPGKRRRTSPHLRDPPVRGAGGGRAGRRPRAGDGARRVVLQRRAGPGLRLHRPRRLAPDCWRYMVEVQDPGLAGGPHRVPLGGIRSTGSGSTPEKRCRLDGPRPRQFEFRSDAAEIE